LIGKYTKENMENNVRADRVLTELLLVKAKPLANGCNGLEIIVFFGFKPTAFLPRNCI